MKNSYVLKWVLQRVTAIFLIPLSFWFIYHCVSFKNLNYQELRLFFQSYFNSLIFVIMMSVMLIHAKLGCDTIVKDYISKPSIKKNFKVFINLITLISLFLVFGAIFKLNLI